MEWISVRKELPPYKELVIVGNIHYDISLGYLKSTGKYGENWGSYKYIGKIHYWMKTPDENHGNWISVDKDLPPFDKNVFVIHDGDFNIGHKYSLDENGFNWFSYRDKKIKNVTHWMEITPFRRRNNKKLKPSIWKMVKELFISKT